MQDNIFNNDRMQYNDKFQRHGYWEVYRQKENDLLGKGYYVDNQKVGFWTEREPLSTGVIWLGWSDLNDRFYAR